MSRQRLRESNIKWSIKLTNESLALKIIKMIEIKTIENNAKIIEVQINNKITDFIDENFKKDLNYFEKKNKVKINIKSNDKLIFSEYLIEYRSKSNKVIEKVEKMENLKGEPVEDAKGSGHKVAFPLDIDVDLEYGIIMRYLEEGGTTRHPFAQNQAK